MNINFGALAFGLALSNAVWTYIQAGKQRDLNEQIAGVLRMVADRQSVNEERVNNMLEHYRNLQKHVETELEDMKGQLPSIEC